MSRQKMRPGSTANPPSHRHNMPHAYQLLQAGNLPAAEKICQEVLRVNPAHADANNCLGVVQQRLGHPEQAALLFKTTLTTDPGYVPAYANLANSLSQLGKMDDAKRVVDRALNLRPEPAIANRALGDLGYRVAEYAKAETFYRRVLAAEPADFDSHVGLGMTLRRLGQFEAALACYKRASKLQPGNASLHFNRGNLLSAMGRINDSITSYRKAIRIRPDHARSHQLLAGVRNYQVYDAELKTMEALFEKPDISVEDRMNLAFGLGKAFEDLQQYDKAFDFFAEGNRNKRSLTPYAIENDVALYDRMVSTFDHKLFDRYQGLGIDDDRPIFILGIPRSGTSLVEQILASHPQIFGAGELANLQLVCKGGVQPFPEGASQLNRDVWENLGQDYLQRLHHIDASAPYVTDKMPLNFLYIGMIALMLPNAKIVHCRRDPIDTCLSVFKNLFASDGLQWSYDIDDLGRYYQLYQTLMTHWENVLPGKIYHVQYEHLVAEPTQQIHELLNFCKIPFDSACLSYHKSKRAVETASFAQVRKPIYNSSVQLWKRYEKHLQPLLSKLRGT